MAASDIVRCRLAFTCEKNRSSEQRNHDFDAPLVFVDLLGYSVTAVCAVANDYVHFSVFKLTTLHPELFPSSALTQSYN